MQVYKSVAIKGYMVEFYHKKGDKKLSFRIQDNEKLTDVLLAHCSEKRVKVESIDFAIRGIREKIEQGILDPASAQTREPQVTSEDYCTKINLYAQKEHGESVYFRVYPRGGVRNGGDFIDAGLQCVPCSLIKQEAGKTARSEKSYLSFCRRTLLMQGAHGKRIEDQLQHIAQITPLSINPNPAVKGSVRGLYWFSLPTWVKVGHGRTGR